MSTLDFDTTIRATARSSPDLKAYRDRAETMRNRVQAEIRGGKSQADVEVHDHNHRWAPDSLNIQWSLPGMMAELK